LTALLAPRSNSSGPCKPPCNKSGETLSGIALNIAARVAALAGPGEVFVSRTVADLAIGVGFSFADRGEHALKGAPGAWRIFAATR
jgi:class 3 adenylate cyclase